LVDDGVLHPEMTKIFTPSDRPLYEHQEKAVKAVIQEQNNIVVATGTGSGKTECFLLPMFDTLLREEEHLLIPGVRVLILYPMGNFSLIFYLRTKAIIIWAFPYNS
jgi:Lhr-like helicase